MVLDFARARDYLRHSDLKSLFIEELGWDRHSETFDIPVDGQTVTLSAIAHKRGMVAFLCTPLGDGSVPDSSARRKIDTQVAKRNREHLIVYTDAAKTTQIWQWVKREPGKPTACREHTYHREQPGDALIQKLQAIAFSLDEEERITIVDVAGRVRAGFDVERVTRRFYDRFKTEHAAFLKFLKGIPDEEMQRWYVSVMINRLMFIYFIEKKGFLDGDTSYLRTRLAQSKRRGRDRFYRDFLCPLFFEGFAKKESERSAEVNQLLGRVPYLNGGLFLRHQIEEVRGKHIQIADAAFERLFDFFDQYRWHLDERPLRADNEINPDVLGYIFEKYVNQKQMGAYYTKEDITEYIAKNTIIPFLFNAAQEKCRIAFEGEASVWRLLQADPDRYIYEAMKKGAHLALPQEIAEGLNDVARRTGWNRTAPEEYALPTEIWREVVARRRRYEEVKAKLLAGEIRSINDLITYNLDIRQFAQDVVENAEGPELVRAFWQAIERVTVLDPTCGSGAFLFAALNILEPIYEACLERMEAFLGDLERLGQKRRPEKYGDFRRILERVGEHPNRRYFILKSIVINNLYGVDIMEEATEICKLRLFLKLVAQVERAEDIEPLPDIDFNIRAGNTLVGFATRDAVKKAMTVRGDGQARLLSAEDMESLSRIEESAEMADRAFKKFREMQTEHGMDAREFLDAKSELRRRLGALQDQLNRYLAMEYGVDADDKQAYQKWLASHHPFHWFIEFYGIMNRGGFDVIVGNPPYVEISDTAGSYSIRGLSLVGTGNLYSVCVERFVQLQKAAGRCGVIVPISSISTPRMLPLMKFITGAFRTLFLSNYAVRPGKLFVGADMNLSIVIGHKGAISQPLRMFATRYNRWGERFRPSLFDSLNYTPTSLLDDCSCIPKIGSAEESRLLARVRAHPPLSRYRAVASEPDVLYYHSGGRYFRKCIRERLSNEYKELAVRKGVGDAVLCLLSSSLYYWFWITVSDCYHVTRRDVDSLRMPESLASDSALTQLATVLLLDLKKNARSLLRTRADGSERQEINFDVGESKLIIDQVDRTLAKHYGFTDEELDFIINYDIKYRMGRDGQEDEE